MMGGCAVTKSCDYESRDDRARYLPTPDEIEAAKAEIKEKHLAARRKLYSWATGPLGHGGIKVMHRQRRGRLGVLSFRAGVLLLALLLPVTAAAQWGRYRSCGNTNCYMCYGLTAAYTGGYRPPPAQAAKPQPPADYAPTPMAAVEAGLDAAGVGPGDVVSDLGCGDGRWLVAAAQRGATAYGYERDAGLVSVARERWSEAGKPGTLAISQTDLRRADLSETTVVVVYLTSDLLGELAPKLSSLSPGTRVVSYMHRLPDVPTQRVFVVGGGVLYLYQTPLD
jgi:hypothetical protein